MHIACARLRQHKPAHCQPLWTHRAMGQGSRFSLTHGRVYYVDESMCLYILIELTTRLVNTRTSCTVSHLISGKGLLRYVCACFGEPQSSSRSCSVYMYIVVVWWRTSCSTRLCDCLRAVNLGGGCTRPVAYVRRLGSSTKVP